ncbi:hypothetical protein K3495_g3471 [Podosphaera aphanis]|nr:hypothetical protein K3495_g3471 [Podosphaera aphanis]
MEEPKWSNGRLESLKKIYNVKQYVQHGEGAAADINSDANVAKIMELRASGNEMTDREIIVYAW